MTYKPGQIAKATVRGVSNVTVMRFVDDEGRGFWFAPNRINGWRYQPEDDVTDVRPLVVLDLADYLDVNWQDFITVTRRRAEEINSTAVGWLVDEIEKQTRPAIEEPKGLGAVVEDDKGAKFVRVADYLDGWMAGRDWQRIGGDVNAVRNFGWSEINVARVLSEGVPS